MTSIEPGIRTDLTNDAYHAETDWLSSSQLKAALPEHYKQGGSQEALDFGTLFHTAVLEPDDLAAYVALDAAKIGLKADGTPAQSPTMTVAWKRAVAEVEQDGKRVVAQSDLDLALRMRESVAAHPIASRLLFSEDGISEESAFAVTPNGRQVKARFDRRIPGAVVDLKSTSAKPGADSLGRACIDYGYDLSAFHYRTVAELLGIELDAFCFVFCEKTDPYRVTVAELGDTFTRRGEALWGKAIDRLTNPAEPAYDGATGFLTIDCPEWALRKVS